MHNIHWQDYIGCPSLQFHYSAFIKEKADNKMTKFKNFTMNASEDKMTLVEKLIKAMDTILIQRLSAFMLRNPYLRFLFEVYGDYFCELLIKLFLKILNM